MIALTHWTFAGVCWYFLAILLGIEFNQNEILICLALGALMPDIDTPRSSIGWVLFPISWALKIFLRWGHRQESHSFMGLAIFAIFFSPLISINFLCWIAFISGYFSHLISDMMTKSGVPLFWPNRAAVVFPANGRFRIKTGTTQEWILAFVCSALLFHFTGVTRPATAAVVDWTAKEFQNATAGFSENPDKKVLGKVTQTLELESLANLKIKAGDTIQMGEIMAIIPNKPDKLKLEELEFKLKNGDYGLSEKKKIISLKEKIISAQEKKEDFDLKKEERISKLKNSITQEERALDFSENQQNENFEKALFLVQQKETAVKRILKDIESARDIFLRSGDQSLTKRAEIENLELKKEDLMLELKNARKKAGIVRTSNWVEIEGPYNIEKKKEKKIEDSKQKIENLEEELARTKSETFATTNTISQLNEQIKLNSEIIDLQKRDLEREISQLKNAKDVVIKSGYNALIKKVKLVPEIKDKVQVKITLSVYE